jgi:hypothetical protein
MASGGTETSIGTISGTGACIFADDGINLLIATTAAGYQYDGSTLTQITDSDYEAGGSVAYLNNQAIWQGFNQRFAVADAGDPDSIQSLNYATAESSGDDLVRVYVFRETWYNSGVGTPPFDRIQSGKMDIGLISRLAVSSNDNYMYWLGDDKNLYRASAYDPQPIMPPSIHNQFSGYDLSSACIKCLTRDGQNFVLILTSSKTWVYSESTQAWFELAYKAAEEIYLASDYTYAYNKHLILSRLDSRVLELDEDIYTDNGEITIRERITAPISGSQLGINGGRYVCKRAEIIMESGVGNLSEANPLIMISHSVDFGQSWSNETWLRAGRDGENNLRVEYYKMINCRQLQFKIRTSDPNFFIFLSLALDVQKGGNY